MAITVGELLVAIQADDTPLRRALADVDRLSRGYADRSASYQKAVTEARQATRDAQRAVNAEQKKFNKLLDESNARAKKNVANTREQNLAMLEQYQKARAAERTLGQRKADLADAIAMRDENRLEKQRANEQLSNVRRLRAAERDAAKGRDAENRQTSDEFMARRRMEKAATRDLDRQRRDTLRAIRNEEKAIGGEWMARYRQQKDAVNSLDRQRRTALRQIARDEGQQAAYWMSRYRAEGRDVGPQRPARPVRTPIAPRGRPRGFTAPGLDTFGITSTLVATAGLAELTRTANEMQVVQQRLAQVSASGQEAAIAFNKLAEGSQRLRQPLGETVELYTKLRQSNQNVGMSANETIKVTEAFSAALRISGATGQTAASSLLQFGQAMAKGKLDGDEFRTVAENASEVLRVLERQTGLSRGELLKMREEGKLTAKMMADALIKEYDNLIDRATKLAPSLSQGTTALKNSLLIAMTNTQDARQAIEKLALMMVSLAEKVQENGPLLLGIGKFALGLLGVATAFGVLKRAHEAYLAVASLGLGPAAAVVAGVLGVNAYATKREAERKAAEESEIANAKRLIDANKVREKMVQRAIVAQKKLQEIEQGSRLLRGGRREKAAREELARSMELLKKAGEQMLALREMQSKPMITTANAAGNGGKSKTAADTIDEELRALLNFAKAGIATEAMLRRITELQDQFRAAMEKTNDVIVKDKMRERLALIEQTAREMEGLNEMLGDGANRSQHLADNFEDLYTEMSPEDVLGVLAYMDTLREQLSQLTFGTEAYTSKLEELRKLQKKIADTDPTSITRRKPGKEGEEEGKKPWWERAIDTLDQVEKRLNRSIMDSFLSAPGAMISAYFQDMANAIANGGRNTGEAMRSAIAGILGGAGEGMIKKGMAKLTREMLKAYGGMMKRMATTTSAFGKFLLAIQKALSNPLVAGAALIAIGVGMAAYAAKMGAAGRGEGGELAGGIGGLSTGGQQQTMRYSFADRRNPLEGNRVVGSPVQPVVVNQTIIGPNDPVAQRQIGELVNNAARRGIIKGNG